MDYQYKVDYPLIAKRIKEARKLAGLTQEQLAEKIEISTNAVAKLENNLMTAFSLPREGAKAALAAAGVPEHARGETLSPERLARLADVLCEQGKG